MNGPYKNRNVPALLGTYLSLVLMTIVLCVKDAQAQDNIPEDFILVEHPSEDNRLLLVLKEKANDSDYNGDWVLYFEEGSLSLNISGGSAAINRDAIPDGTILFTGDGNDQVSKLYYIKQNKPPKEIPLWLTILPPLIAIGLALFFREVLLSLFIGLWIGGIIAAGYDLSAIITGLFTCFDSFMVHAIGGDGHPQIILFSMMIGAMVALISKNGGMRGIVNLFAKVAKSSRSTQFVTWLLGIAIFFDDYANTLIVGNTMKPMADRFKVSREKLAYIVDSTAAPIAAIAFITTWIGAEIGYIQDALVSMPGMKETAYGVFLNSLKYAYYPIFTLIFILALIYFGRDYGPMWLAERNALQGVKPEDSDVAEMTEDLNPKEGLRSSWIYGLIPILTLLGVTMFGLLQSGFANMGGYESDESFMSNLQIAIGEADSLAALVWGSGAGMLIAAIMSVLGRKLNIKEANGAVMAGFTVMLPAICILVLAWSLAGVISILHTDVFLISLIPDGFNPFWLPAIFFLLSAIVSFSTGSSWGTMAILYPIALPLTWEYCRAMGMPVHELQPILYNLTAVILAGSVLGDHCSPISDTTILSSMASGCNHIEHVRTQMPYAVTIGGLSLFTGGLAFALGIPWWLNYLLGIGLIISFVRFFGKTQKIKGA